MYLPATGPSGPSFYPWSSGQFSAPGSDSRYILGLAMPELTRTFRYIDIGQLIDLKQGRLHLKTTGTY